MKVIKFRAIAKCIHNWDGYNELYNVNEGDMAYGYYYQDAINNEDSDSAIHVDYIRIPYGDHFADIEIDPETLEQFARLKDSKGTELNTYISTGETKGDKE